MRTRVAIVAGAVFGLGLPACTERRAPEGVPAVATDAVVAEAVVVDASHDEPSLLARDLAARTSEAHRRYGEKARVATVGEEFVLVGVGGNGELFDKARTLLERALPAFYDGKFSKRPSESVTVFLFATSDAFVAYAKGTTASADMPYGMFLPGPREIAVDGSVGPEAFKTLTHEAVHVLMDADFPLARGWFREGLASYFEEPVLAADGGIGGAPKNWRHPALVAALRSPQDRGLVRLDPMFGLTEVRMREGGEHDVGLRYALARSVCAWLDAKGELWTFYRAYREGWREDESGRRAFARVTGGTPAEKEEEWRRSVE